MTESLDSGIGHLISKALMTYVLREAHAERGTIVPLDCRVAGSHYRGYATVDSDVDVRIIYRRPLPEYLSIFKIDRPVDMMKVGDIEILGWDLRRFLYLLWSNDIAAVEYCYSPHTYGRADLFLRSGLTNLAEISFDPQRQFMGYFGLANKMRKELPDSTWEVSADVPDPDLDANAKRLLFAYHSLLSARYIHIGNKRPPIPLLALSSRLNEWEYVDHQAVRNLINARRVRTPMILRSAMRALAPSIASLDGLIGERRADMVDRGLSEEHQQRLGVTFDEFLRLIMQRENG